MKKNNYQKISIYLGLFFLITFFGFPKISQAADFYVDPVHGSMSNDGSQAHPWLTMQEVWDNGKIDTRKYGNGPNPTPPYAYVAVNPTGPVHAGDTIYLLSGYHGDLVIIGALNTDYITVKAAPGSKPTFRHIDLLAASRWIFDGISVSPSYYSTHLASAIFEAPRNDYQGPSSYITLKNSEVFSIPDITGITQEYWMANATLGVFFNNAPNCIIDNVKIYNVTGGVGINSSPYCELKNSEIKNVMGDGVGIYQANYLKIEYNVIKNIFDPPAVLGLHTDLIQFSSDGVMANAMTGVEVRGNTVIAHEDEHQPFMGPTQGISGFDGFYRDFVIENNLVMVGTNHGMSYYGAINCQIVNNTCVIPWASDAQQQCVIRITKHKNGTPSTGNIVRNNISTAVSVDVDSTVVDHNITIARSAYPNYFIDPASFDFHLKATSAAVNAGSTDLAPSIDISQAARDATPDVGAYEYPSGDITPPAAPTDLSVL